MLKLISGVLQVLMSLARGGIVSDQQNIINNKSESYVESCFGSAMPSIAVSEYQKLYSEQIRKWVNGNYICLGTDGFGRSDTQEKSYENFLRLMQII